MGQRTVRTHAARRGIWSVRGRGYHMGWVRFGASGCLLLGFAGVALVAATANAVEWQHHRDVDAQELHHLRLVHHRVQATPLRPVATSAAVRMAAQLPDEQSTIIVTTPEPGAVATSTKPAPNTSESGKPEPEADDAAKPQAHGPGGWLIQIGAFELEAEAMQHLSEAQLNARTALAAADPFTEPVQRGEKLLYRARFAVFDKETAEIACKQLKRGHFECMVLKN
jgi:cell division septation protein DedD